MPASTPSPSSPASAADFSSFVVDRVARNPFLIHETPRSLHTASSTNGSSGGGGAPSTLDATQRAVLLHPSSVSVANPTNATAVTAILQRSLVDVPLLPMGGMHLLHELVWSNFLAAAEAAKQVGGYAKALALHDARVATEGTATAVDSAATGASPVENVFNASPLATGSPTAPLPASSLQGEGSSTNGHGSGAGKDLLSPEELSRILAPELLRAHHAQALARLAESKAVLQRGLAKLRRMAQDLHDYDAIPIAELRQRLQPRMRALIAPVVVPPSSSVGGDTAASAVADGEQDRKRQRTAE